MIFGIGTDILRVERVDQLHDRYGERFAERLLMPEEADDVSDQSATSALSRHAVRREGSHRQGDGHRVCARHVDPRHWRRAQRLGSAGDHLVGAWPRDVRETRHR